MSSWYLFAQWTYTTIHIT